MPITIGIKNSADPGNLTSFGSDGGVYVPTSQPRSGHFLYTIDNSWNTDATTWYHALPGNGAGSTNGSGTLGTAQLWPFMVTRTCRLIDAYFRTNTGAAATLFLSMYATDPATGLPGALITDIGSSTVATSSTNYRIAPASTLTLTAYTLYWMATVQRGSALATVFVRPNGFGSLRTSALPQIQAYYVNASMTSVLDTGFTSASPATATPSSYSGGSNATSVPFFWWGLSNS